MPSRILKESICSSDTINDLSIEAECFFYRLLVQCDDFGRLDARPSVLRARCFPLRLEKVSDKLVVKWLSELVAVNLLWTYVVDDRTYLQVRKWSKHQQIRSARSKYPPPDCIPPDLISPEINGNQMKSFAPDIRIQSESESESKSEERARELRAAPSSDPAQVRVFLANGGKFQTGKLEDGTSRRERAAQYIAEHVTDDPDSLKLWGRVVAAYCMVWSPKSYTVMVNDYYLRGRVPGEPQRTNGANGRNGHAPAVAVIDDVDAEFKRMNPGVEL